MSLFPHVGWQGVLVGLTAILTVVLFACSRWESSYHMPEPDRSTRRNSTEAVP